VGAANLSAEHAKSLQTESRFRAEDLFGRMTLSEKSARFGIML
jgi:hypothetical protein